MAVAAPSEADRPAPARPRRPRASRVSMGHAVIALAALVAVVANYAALRARDDSVRVAVLAADVAAGAPVGAEALAFADLRADQAVLATLVTPDVLADLDGRVAARALAAGDVLRRSDLVAATAPGGLRAMSVPIAPERAVGGRLRAGDRVDVIEVRDGEAVYLMTDAEVLDVPERVGATGLGGLQTFSVTLAVDAESALRLALALATGDLALVRSTGAEPAQMERIGTPEAGP